MARSAAPPTSLPAPRTPPQVARSYLASFSRRDVDAIAAHVAEGFVNEHASALGGGSTGRVEYLERLPGFLAMFSELSYDVEYVLDDGARVMAAYRMTAVHEGHPVDIRGVMSMVIADKLIQRRTDYWDSLTFLRQTGQA